MSLKSIAVLVTLGLILGTIPTLSDAFASSNIIPPGGTLNLYLSDDDLNVSRSGFDTVSTEGILEFFINGISISGPKTMTETAPNSGVFLAKIVIPTIIDGKPVDNGSTLTVRYNDQSDASGNTKTTSKSFTIMNSFAQLGVDKNPRIGHDFTVLLYEPDANLDSDDVDKISLNKIQFKAKNGIKTTLANPAFDANSSFLLETGENTNLFAVTVKIPREIDGKTVHIGSWFELTYVDNSSPSQTTEEIEFSGKIGLG